MRKMLPPMPPAEEVRVVDGDLCVRVAEVGDVDNIFALKTNPALDFVIRQGDRPGSVEQLREAIERPWVEPGQPTQNAHWVLELAGTFGGYFKTKFDMRNNQGRREGLLLRSAIWQVYLDPEFISQGITRRMHEGIIENTFEILLVRHFGIEQLIVWIDDANENARAMVTQYGFEGPLNHLHPGGLGFYRRQTKDFPQA